MKEITVHSLAIARTLLEQAQPLCTSEDRYAASAGLCILQDALETIFCALLIEKGVDETTSIERKSFDELIAELRKAGLKVPKSGTLKALNRQRVLTKHYAQVAEPITVRNYFDAASVAIEALTHAVLGRSLRNLFFADLLPQSEARRFLEAAETAIAERKYLSALIEIRKAIYVEFENEYSVDGWKDKNPQDNQPEGLLTAMVRGGLRAPYWTRNKTWIDANVKVPTDFVQVDIQAMRLQAMEYGIHTEELQNIRRLTPDVFRASGARNWEFAYDVHFPENNATETNARYCLDRTVSVIVKKHLHASARRDVSRATQSELPPIYSGQPVYAKADENSELVGTVLAETTYHIYRVISGSLNAGTSFYEVMLLPNDTGTAAPGRIYGFVAKVD